MSGYGTLPTFSGVPSDFRCRPESRPSCPNLRISVRFKRARSAISTAAPNHLTRVDETPEGVKAITTHIDFIYDTYRSMLSFSKNRQAGFTAKTESSLDRFRKSDQSRTGGTRLVTSRAGRPGRYPCKGGRLLGAHGRGLTAPGAGLGAGENAGGSQFRRR